VKKSNKLLAVFLALAVVILFISIYCIAVNNEFQNQSPDSVAIIENNQLSIVDDVGRHGVVSLDIKKDTSFLNAPTYISSEVASLEVFPIFFILLAAIFIATLFFSGYKFTRNSNTSVFCAAPGI
jgi:uncharacterized membrane protein AbrB (regulator of aidB expression)